MRAVLNTLLGVATLAPTAPSQAQPSDLQQRRQQMLQIKPAAACAARAAAALREPGQHGE